MDQRQIAHSPTDRLLERIATKSADVAVLGQGYVGLTLAASAAAAGFSVTGIDIDDDRIAALTRGDLSVPGVNKQLVGEGVATGRLSFIASPSTIARSDVVVICVPTPLFDQAPDLSHVEMASRTISEHLRPGTLIILESTTYPGTTEKLVRPILEGSGLRSGTDFLLAYSPERIDPGNEAYNMENTPRVVGGVTLEATAAATTFYEHFVDSVVPVSGTRAAETSKLLENTFRHINIALVNELAMLCHELDIDVWEVIDAAATKPFGFLPFYPGPGVGGHCIPLDPTYLAWQIRRESGRRFGVLEQAQDVNDRMPNYVASRVAEILNRLGRPVQGARILVAGVTYKPDVGDVRESPALRVMAILAGKGAELSFHDPFVEEISINGVTLQRSELEPALEAAELVVLLTPHATYDLDSIARRARVVFDTRNAFGHRDTPGPENVIAL